VHFNDTAFVAVSHTEENSLTLNKFLIERITYVHHCTWRNFDQNMGQDSNHTAYEYETGILNTVQLNICKETPVTIKHVAMKG
jgi:hypothetical protein